MNGVRDMFERLTSYELANVPVGAGLMLTLSDALASAMSDLARGMVGLPPIILDSGLAYVDGRFKFMEKLIGVHGQYLVDSILVKRAVDSQFDLTGNINRFLNKLTGKVAPTSGLESPSPVGEITSAPEPYGDVGDIVTTPQIGEGSDIANILEARESFFKSMSE